MPRLVCLCLAFIAGFADAGSVSNATETAVSTGKYRMWFSKTYGDDHLCLTEIELYDANQARLDAALVSMSSCYGCTSCTGCTHRYGNPEMLFDKDATSEGADAWSCTAPGTFVDGVGSQSVVFTLSGKPRSYILQRPQVNGDWVTRDWSLEEELSDGTWQIIDNAVDAEKRPDQSRDITMVPFAATPVSLPNPRWSYATPDDWVKDYPTCGGHQQSPIDLDLMTNAASASRGETKLPYKYQPLMSRALANTGATVQVAGNFGDLTLPGGVYKARQFHFHFPPEHRIGGDEHLAIGELQIVHQKVGSKGADDLAMVSIMLHLPLESDVLKGQEQFFIDMGMLAIPPVGQYSPPQSKSVDLSNFAEQLNGNFWHYTGSLAAPPCTEGVQWFIMEKYALISGVVVQQFKNAFPDPANSRPIQKTNGRVVSLNKLPVAGVKAVAAAL